MTRPTPPLGTIAREWLRIGLTGFGGPPAHITLLRELIVRREGWMDARSFEDANAACSLLTGPSSTQLSIFCAYRVGGPLGAVIGPSHHHAMEGQGHRTRWLVCLLAGVAAIAIGPYLVLVLVACGVLEMIRRRRPAEAAGIWWPLPVATASMGGLGVLAWTAFKVGALSFGGGFVIIPLMQQDAVHVYHWMTDAHFLNAVALGQVTPGPVVATVAAVGYAAHGVGGAVLAAAVAFTPSFSFILLGGGRFERLRRNYRARAFLDGAGPAAIGAILGSAVTLAAGIDETWQIPVLAAAAFVLLILRRGVVPTLLGAGAVGAAVALASGPLP